jgi:hypothetical protein
MFEIKTFTGLDGLRQVKDQWTHVFQGLSRKSFQYHYDWYRCYLEFLAPEEEIFHVYLIYNDREPVAIFPLREGTMKFHGVKLKVLETPHHGHLPFTDCIYENSERTSEVLTYFIKNLSAGAKMKWDAVVFHNLLEGSPVLASLAKDSKVRAIKYLARKCSFFLTEGTYDDITRAFTGNHRRNLKKKGKRLDSLGKIEFVNSEKLESLVRDFDDFMEVEASGFKGEKGTKSAINFDDRLIGFYKSLIESFAEEGGCNIHLLKLNGESIASQFCLLDDETMYVFKIAYREDFAQVSPGMILLGLSLDAATQNEKIKRVNLMTYKDFHRNWKPEFMDVFHVWVFNKSMMGTIKFEMIRMRRWLRSFYDAIAKKTLRTVLNYN